jgi:DNA-binding CsgD family transcriptional regulator
MALVDAVRTEGIAVDAALAEVGLSAIRLREPGMRIDWAQYVRLSTRIEQLCGDSSTFERGFERNYPQLLHRLVPVARQVVSPRSLFGFVNRVVMPAAYRNVLVTETDLPDGRLVVRIVIPEPYAPFLGFFRATRGAMRSATLSLGLPPCQVEAVFSDREGTFSVRMPPSQTVVARLREASPATLRDAYSRVAEFLGSEGHPGEDELGSLHWIIDMSARLREETEARQRAEEALRTALGVTPGALFSVSSRGEVSALDDSSRSALGDQGEALSRRVRAVAEGAPDPSFQTFAIGQGDDAARLVLQRDVGQLFEARLRRLAKLWGLTPRQAEVVGLVAKGFSNKEIAEKLGCTLHTVELHVSQAFQRTLVPNRAALVASFWTS